MDDFPILLNGVDAEVLTPAQIQAIVPFINLQTRYPVLGASFQRRAGIARRVVGRLDPALGIGGPGGEAIAGRAPVHCAGLPMFKHSIASASAAISRTQASFISSVMRVAPQSSAPRKM